MHRSRTVFVETDTDSLVLELSQVLGKEIGYTRY